jgi:hypothetical protein
MCMQPLQPTIYHNYIHANLQQHAESSFISIFGQFFSERQNDNFIRRACFLSSFETQGIWQLVICSTTSFIQLMT